MDRMVGETEAWIEAFGGQVGDLERIGVMGEGDAFGDLRRQAMGQGVGIMVGNDNECMHGQSPAAVRTGTRYASVKLPLVSYGW
ncbi:hypothetical protein [Pseudomonas sp. 7SR1]|uniref:hypothetical protein n=1 Tax=Pseudomonas sp. 7SR1 TaxID=1881017 RepID=UPI001E2E2E99|nr:hypothetical protein [Pseudomonas sp. 7SR1]